jgi:hypothetical protein
MTNLKRIKEKFKEIPWVPLMIVGVALALLVILVNVMSIEGSKPKYHTDRSLLTAVANCDDGVVCYWYSRENGLGMIKGGMSCFRDADLVEKYCGGE